jgi:hypothetical protein
MTVLAQDPGLAAAVFQLLAQAAQQGQQRQAASQLYGGPVG